MTTASTTSTQRVIMRRVYYSYALSVLTHPACLIGVVFFGSAYAVKELVHVARVWEYFISIPIGHLPEFGYSLVTHTEASTLLATATMCISLCLLVRLFRRHRVPAMSRQLPV